MLCLNFGRAVLRRRPNLKTDWLNEIVLIPGRRRSTALPHLGCRRKTPASSIGLTALVAAICALKGPFCLHIFASYEKANSDQ